MHLYIYIISKKKCLLLILDLFFKICCIYYLVMKPSTDLDFVVITGSDQVLSCRGEGQLVNRCSVAMNTAHLHTFDC